MKIEEKPKPKEDSMYNPNTKSYSSSESEGNSQFLFFTNNLLKGELLFGKSKV